jgi:hypothetical protein
MAKKCWKGAGLDQIGPTSTVSRFYSGAVLSPKKSAELHYRRRNKHYSRMSDVDHQRCLDFRRRHGLPIFSSTEEYYKYLTFRAKLTRALSVSRRHPKKPTLPRLKFMEHEIIE